MQNKFSCLRECVEPFKGILLDAYGVFWGGNEVGFFPGALAVMESLVSQGKVVGILSNTTHKAQTEINKLKNRGLEQGRHFHFYLTAGGVARALFEQEALPFPTPHKKYWLLGSPHPKYASHLEIFEGTVYEEAKRIEDADFIYLLVPHIKGKDETDPNLFIKEIQNLKEPLLPLICPNPDRFSLDGDPIRFVVRQGTLADFYEKRGGQVFHTGKPSRCAYLAAMGCFTLRGVKSPEEILMVGDTPETDIRGANQFGMRSALILKTGIMGMREKKELRGEDIPNFFVESLA